VNGYPRSLSGHPEPAGRLTGLGEGVWGYESLKDGGPVWAVWTTGEEKEVMLPVRRARGRIRTVEIVDIMGGRTTVGTQRGRARITEDTENVVRLPPL
jgi:hypothetical protein